MSKPSGELDAAVTFEFQPGDPLSAARSEAQALFLLAGWRRHVAGGTPLRLVCVNDPPDTVLALAELCGATVTVRSPFALENGTFFNRVLGWEAPGESDRRLVLASDVLVLREFTGMSAELPAGILSLAPADKTQIPEGAWKTIYDSLGLPLPEERALPLRSELGLVPAHKRQEVLPYYHSGVVLAPRECNFGRIWSEHLRKLADLLPRLEGVPPRQGTRLANSGRVALTTAARAVLVAGGGRFRRLPRSYDGRLADFESAAGAGEVRLLHARHLFGDLIDLAQIEEQLNAYVGQLQGAVFSGVEQRGGSAVRARWTARWKVRWVRAALRRLYLHEVRPVLRRCGALG